MRAGATQTELESAARRAWFRREVLPLEPELRAYLRRLTRNPDHAEDLLHEVFARIIAHAHWREIDNASAFATRTARNVVYDELRRRKVVAIDFMADMGADIADDEPGAERAVIARDELRRLAAIVAALPTQQRRVFTLRKVYDLSPQAIADRLGLSVSTVEKHLVRAVRHCAEALGRDGEAPVAPPKRSVWNRLRNTGGEG